MELLIMYEIGDKVQAHDGRIGTVINTEISTDNPITPSSQYIVVKFPDGSIQKGALENFTAVFERPFAKVEPSIEMNKKSY